MPTLVSTCLTLVLFSIDEPMIRTITAAITQTNGPLRNFLIFTA
jgi:hypothetical protein